MGRHGLPRTGPARKPAESTSEADEGQRDRGLVDGEVRSCRLPAVNRAKLRTREEVARGR
jgi:hypothetical protein